MRRLVGLLLVACATLAACGGKSPLLSLRPPEQKITAGDYDEYLRRWARNAKIIKQLDTTLRVDAVFLAPEYAAAYTAKRADLFKLPDRETREVAAELRERWERSFPFVVAAASMDYNWNDFDRKGSVWRINLENDQGDKVSAVTIKSMGSVDATIEELFPFVDRFHRIYDIRFPRDLPDGRPLVTPDTRKLFLQFAGPLGHAKLEWRIR